MKSVRDDFSRLRVVAWLGEAVARAWDQTSVAAQYARRMRDADWWRLLEVLRIPFDGHLLTIAATAAASPAGAEDQDDRQVGPQPVVSDYLAGGSKEEVEAAKNHALGLLPALMSETRGHVDQAIGFSQCFGVETHLSLIHISEPTRPY